MTKRQKRIKELQEKINDMTPLFHSEPSKRLRTPTSAEREEFEILRDQYDELKEKEKK